MQALEAYVESIDARAAALVVAVDKAIRKAHPDFDTAIKYGLLIYALNGDWRTWVCSVGAKSNGVALRFLYGVLLDDPRHMLRSGSSVLKTWDFAFGERIDEVAVAEYVSEAVAKYADYKANAPKVLEASRAAAKSRPAKGRA
jgi:hypothetical protein